MTNLEGAKTVRVGPKGQVVVPKKIRDKLGIEPGDEMVVSEQDGEVRVRKHLTLQELRGILGPPTGMADWDEEKRRERELEDRKDRALEDWLNRS
jgi:AbrB family looped-hinge helix DNA binding protein